MEILEVIEILELAKRVGVVNPDKKIALDIAVKVLKRIDDKMAIHNIFCKDCNVMDCEEADKYTQAIASYLQGEK